MIPIPVLSHGKLIAAAIVAVVIAGVVANTYRLSAAVDREHAALLDSEVIRERLKGALDEQNKSVEAWKSAAVIAGERADAALDAASKLEASRRQVVSELDAWKRKPGENACDATIRLLQEYPR